MILRARSGLQLVVALVTPLILSGCGSVELRQSMEPIEVIENNFVESNDAEIVYLDIPSRTKAVLAQPILG